MSKSALSYSERQAVERLANSLRSERRPHVRERITGQIDSVIGGKSLTRHDLALAAYWTGHCAADDADRALASDLAAAYRSTPADTTVSLSEGE